MVLIQFSLLSPLQAAVAVVIMTIIQETLVKLEVLVVEVVDRVFLEL
jgi:hypothetical protein